MLEERDMPRDAEVMAFAGFKAQRERREREDLQRGIAAAVDAIYEWTRPKQDVRVAIIVVHGDPFRGVEDHPESGQSVPVTAQFISLDEARPLTDAQRRYLAIETVRAASEPLFQEMSLGLGVANFIEELAEAAEGGDVQAEARYTTLLAALGTDRYPKPGDRS